MLNDSVGENFRELQEFVDGTTELSDLIEKKLSDTQYRILMAHVFHPDKSPKQIASMTGLAVGQVYRAINSEWFRDLNREVARRKKGLLTQLAVKALGDCLRSENDHVKLKAAVRILEDETVMESNMGGSSSGPVNIVVNWDGGPKRVEPVQ